MNARSHVLELAVESCQLEEAFLSLLHPILFHRTLGKFTYSMDCSYSVGCVGFEDVDCDTFDHTYIRTASPGLDTMLREPVSQFIEDLKRSPGLKTGQLCLEFYQRKKNRWPFNPESIIWEVWVFRVEIITLASEQERQQWRQQLGELLAEKTMYVSGVLNKPEFVPKMPSQCEQELIFNTTLPDVQPYLFKVSHSTESPGSPAVGIHTVRRLLKDTLSL